ncbi:9027_t:CDS:2 [Dentiscutata erythropus]|uniref:9027_t:CDS:1 n=1 Tax=Dentiscutata erythropus TaxID=1348616 RepID=A0A9N9DZE1_9GLOM|nr:9027_t:CDS:2 [Dentiscutata erythropus]
MFVHVNNKDESNAARIPQNSQRDVNPLLNNYVVATSPVNPVLKHGNNYVVATSEYNDNNGVTGLITFAQDVNSDRTFVNGLFSSGFDEQEKGRYGLFLRDCDDNVIYNLTGELCFDGHSGIKPFQDYIHLNLSKYLFDEDNSKRQGGTKTGIDCTCNSDASASATPVP